MRHHHHHQRMSDISVWYRRCAQCPVARGVWIPLDDEPQIIASEDLPRSLQPNVPDDTTARRCRFATARSSRSTWSTRPKEMPGWYPSSARCPKAEHASRSSRRLSSCSSRPVE